MYMCDENEIEQANLEDNNCIIVKSIENYKFKIKINNEKNIAEITEIIKENEKVELATITFDANTDKAQGNMEEQKIKKGQNTKLSPNMFTRNRYKFKEWNTSADGTGVSYANEAEINSKEDLILYAMWLPDVAKTYLYNEGQTNSEIISIEQYICKGYSNVGTFKSNPTYLSVRKTSSNGEWKALYLLSKGKFDFTGYTKLCCSFSYMSIATAQSISDGVPRQAGVTVGISTSNTETDYDGFSCFFNKRNTIKSPPEFNAVSEGARILEVDISDFDDFAFLKLWCNTNNWMGQRTDFNIDKIWVE